MTEWRPSAGPLVLAGRARLLSLIRDFFYQREVLEVETPLLSTSGNSDPEIKQFTLGGENEFYLRTSPEYAMKRLLAAGAGDIFELGRVFRAEESGGLHNPEFTLLEWYRNGWTYTKLMTETAELAAYCGKAFGHDWPVQNKSYWALFSEFAGVDPFTADPSELSACASAAGVNLTGTGDLDRDGWLDLLLCHIIQPALPANTLTLVRDFPASQSALARIRQDDPPVAERFELFLGGVELANGYQELTDAVEQRQRFEAENNKRRAKGQYVAPLDERLLAAMAHGMPECAGVAMGVDRVLMACLRLGRIEKAIAFPFDLA